MASDNNDHNTWVYHALHEAKIVKSSEAAKLFKQGWRDSPDPKTLYKGVRGKWYKFILWSRSFKKKESKHWNSYNLVIAVIMCLGVAVAFAALTNKNDATIKNNHEQQKVIQNKISHV